MCGSLFGGGKSASVTKAQAPTVSATAPPAEQTAEAPVINEADKGKNSLASNRKGTAALRINLNLGGGDAGGGGTSGLSIPA